MIAQSECRPVHTFHIPVMGTGFTIDTPLRVARFGISSVISLVDDVLIEQMRAFHSEREGERYHAIPSGAEDVRARRIEAYLNLVDKLVARQMAELKAAPFEDGSDLGKYFRLLPPGSDLGADYDAMLRIADPDEKARCQAALRERVKPGRIDVNIMTKLNRPVYRRGAALPAEFNDAMAALRGFARSNVASALVLSAGFNPKVYGYAAEFEDFRADETGYSRKQIILKVSDYRSAAIQGMFLAKRGLWVSEYRVESGLNCGGHAFATQGLLMGPILAEFRDHRDELLARLHQAYCAALEKQDRARPTDPRAMRITVQGGIGTADEQAFLLDHYGVDGTGWATPFLLAPDVVSMDEQHLEKLRTAGEDDVYLSDSSPICVPFWNLRDSASEELRRERIRTGTPGSPCTKGFLATNCEFTKVPICRASNTYQEHKVEQLNRAVAEPVRSVLRDYVFEKSCICHDLGGAATLKNGIDPNAAPAICCGPNIVNFSKITSLEEMVGHIQGRLSLLANPARPHMFTSELRIYLDHLRRDLEKFAFGLPSRGADHYVTFKQNIENGISYYRDLAVHLVATEADRFLDDIEALAEELSSITIRPVEPEPLPVEIMV